MTHKQILIKVALSKMTKGMLYGTSIGGAAGGLTSYLLNKNRPKKERRKNILLGLGLGAGFGGFGGAGIGAMKDQGIEVDKKIKSFDIDSFKKQDVKYTLPNWGPHQDIAKELLKDLKNKLKNK